MRRPARPLQARDEFRPRVLMIGIFYAPEPTGIGPYMTGLAEMIATFADVEVFTGVPHYPTWQVQAGYRWRFRFREERGGVDVRRFLHFVPRRQSAIKRALLESSFVINTALSRPLRRPDVVIASTPSLGAAVLAARFAKRYQVPYGLVVQDLVGQGAGQSGIAGGAAVANIVGRVEARTFRDAAIVAVVTDSFRSQVAAYGVGESKVRLLPNWSHIAPATKDRAAVRRSMGWDDATFVVLHTGNMGMKQDLGNVIEAARMLSARKDVRIVLCGDGSQRPTLMKQAKGLPNLQFVDTVPDDYYADLLHASDLLLVNERSSVGDMALPSKLTSYFASGRAVLAAVGSDGACAYEIDKTNGAARVIEPGEPAVLAAAIEQLALDGEATASMGAAGAHYAEAHLSRAAAERRAHTLVGELLAYHRDAPSAGSA